MNIYTLLAIEIAIPERNATSITFNMTFIEKKSASEITIDETFKRFGRKDSEKKVPRTTISGRRLSFLRQDIKPSRD